jgi:hypothetical protein
MCPNDTSDRDGLYKRRWAHIGNDAVHVVWCERAQDYTLSLLPTQVRL